VSLIKALTTSKKLNMHNRANSMSLQKTLNHHAEKESDGI
jgi:hypothetical protein